MNVETLKKIEQINKLNNDTLVLHDEYTVLRENKQPIAYTDRQNHDFDPVFFGTPGEVIAWVDSQLPKAPVVSDVVESKKK